MDQIMTGVTLRPLWPSDPTSPTLYCLHKSGRVCTQSREKQLYIFYLAVLGAIYMSHSSTRLVHNLMKSQQYTYLGSEGCLILLLSVAEYDRLCAQIEEKQLCTWQHSMDSKPYVKLAEGCLTLPSSVSAFNEVCIQFQEKKKQLYTYETRLSDSVHNSRKKQLYTNLAFKYRSL